MSDYTNSLKEALALSPENIPLRLLLAESFLKELLYREAESEFRTILGQQPSNAQAKLGLAKIYFAEKKYPTAIVITEELLSSSPDNVELLLMISKALLRNDEAAKASASQHHT